MFNLDRANAEEFLEIYKGVVTEYTQMVTELCSGPCLAIEVTIWGGGGGGGILVVISYLNRLPCVCFSW